MLDEVEARLAADADLRRMTSARRTRCGARYFEALAAISRRRAPGQMVVDKFPLHMARMPLIHRLFPDAQDRSSSSAIRATPC